MPKEDNIERAPKRHKVEDALQGERKRAYPCEGKEDGSSKRPKTASPEDLFTEILKKSKLEDFIEDSNNNAMELDMVNPLQDPKLFSMINNDAWLINSNFQGGNRTVTAQVFKKFIDKAVEQKAEDIVEDTPEEFVKLQLAVNQIFDNSEKMKQTLSLCAFNPEVELPEAEVKKKETERLNSIKQLAEDFHNKIKVLTPGQSFFVPGGYYKHAMLYEFRKATTGEMHLIVYNTGGGLEYHEQQDTFEHGVFKKKHFPACVYEFSKNKIDTLAFRDYLTEVLKTDIASNWKKLKKQNGSRRADDDLSIETIAKEYTQEDLYDHVLPLAAHLGGKRVDPQHIVTGNPFITGQRSGKCSEAIFHPVIREILKDEKKYQRFMVAYRKTVIAEFVLFQEQQNNLTEPVINRQIKNAIANLSRRIYKHKDWFTSDEISSIVEFVVSIENKLKLEPSEVSFDNMDMDFESYSDVSWDLSMISLRLPSRINSANLDRTITFGEQTKDATILPLIECSIEDKVCKLIERLQQALTQVKQLSADGKPHREIVARIEKILLTWPVNKKIEINSDQKNTILNCVKELISIYCQQNILQFGMNVGLGRKFEGLYAKQIATIMSAIAIIFHGVLATENKQLIVGCIRELLIDSGINSLMQRNKCNPYLASSDFSYDVRFKELLDFYSDISKSFNDQENNQENNQEDNKEDKQKSMYLDFLKQQQEVNLNLLTQIYDREKGNICRRNSIDDEALKFLSREQQCLLVLCYCRKQVEAIDDNNVDFKKMLQEFDFIVNLEHVVYTLQSLLSNNLKDSSRELTQDFTSSHLEFKPQKRYTDGSHQWKLNKSQILGDSSGLSKTGLENSIKLTVEFNRRDKNIYIFAFNNSATRTEHPVLCQDINQSRTLLGNADFFKSSRVQVEGDFDDVYEKQFCHTRSSVDTQFFATINFFQENIELLSQEKWQTLCELNLFQPNVLLMALEQTPTALDTLYGFLEKGLAVNIKNGAINDAALFFIKMQMLFNNYLIQFKKGSGKDYKDHHEKLLLLYKSFPKNISQTLDEKIKSQLYSYQVLLLSFLIPLGTQKDQFILDYVTAKLQCNKGNLVAVDPQQFIMQENCCFNMRNILVENLETVTKACEAFLKEKNLLNSVSDFKPMLRYPSLFYNSIVINLETGLVLKNGKEYLPLPKEIFNNNQFKDLFGEKITHGFHSMVFGDKEPSIFEVGNEYFIQKTTKGYVFQKDILINPMDDTKQRYQLVSYEELGQLNMVIPKTLIDDSHRFWMKIDEPKELLIEKKSTNEIICKLDNVARQLRTKDGNCEIFTQNKVKHYSFGKIFEKFEDVGFIEIYQSQDDKKDKYIIKLPRYQLTFEVVGVNPLKIKSTSEPEGNLVLNDSLNNLVNIRNALFIKKKSGETVAILPRQYFIAKNAPVAGVFEYTELCLDSTNKRQNLVLNNGNQDISTKYCEQSEFIEFKLNANNNTLVAKDSGDALYLAYTYLANFDPIAAFKVLEECEKSGGLRCTQREMEHLMLLFTGLPAQSYDVEKTDEKEIRTPEYIAVQAYAIYLYASAKHKQVDIEFNEPVTLDGKVFYKDTKNFDLEKQKVDTILTAYQQIKNNISIDIKLTAKQELECLRLTSDLFLDLPRKKLLIDGLLQEQATVAVDDSSKLKKINGDKQDILDSVLDEIKSEYQSKEDCVFEVKESDKISLITGWINSVIPTITPTSRCYCHLVAVVESKNGNNTKVAIKSKERFVEVYANDNKIAQAMDQLGVNLGEEQFFKLFLTYYHIATLERTEATVENKEKLKTFLEAKLKIIGNNHPIDGQELMVILYQILDGTLISSRLDRFLTQQQEHFGFGLEGFSKLIGYSFDSAGFYTSLISSYRATLTRDSTLNSIKVTVEGIKIGRRQKSKKFLELLQQQGHFGKPKEQPSVIKPLQYRGNLQDIFKKHNLSKVQNIQLRNILQRYKQIESSRNTEINILKKALLESSAGKSRIEIEQTIGETLNAIKNQQVDFATNKIISSELTRIEEQINQFISASIDAKQKLKISILKLANQGSSSLELNQLHKLGLQGKVFQDLNEEAILNLYLLGDEQSFMDATRLSKAQVAELYNHITEYLVVATHCNQLQNIQEQLTNIPKLPEGSTEKSFALKNLLDTMVAENLVDLAKPSAAPINVFQFCRKILLRQDQIDYLLPNIEVAADGKYQDTMSQLIMGFGKTFLLPIVAKAKAKGNNLSVIEVPDALFETNFVDLNNISMRFLNQKTQGFRFNRNTPCSSRDLKNLYEWLTSIKQNRDYVVTTGETVASINLRYFEILKNIVDTKQQEIQESQVVSELKQQASWLEKIVKLFKYEADAIVDEVHSGLNVRKKLIYSIGTEKVSSKEITTILEFYKFLLPLKVWPIDGAKQITIQDIINNPGLIPPGNEDNWKNMMAVAVDWFLTNKPNPIYTVISLIGEELLFAEDIIRKYLLNELSTEEEFEQLNSIFDKLDTYGKDTIALYKAELTGLLPATLKKENRKHYGLLAEEYLLKQPCAVPFVASDTPNIISKKHGKITTTHFANPDETINYTIQAYIVDGLPKSIVHKILNMFEEKAKLELFRDNQTNYAATETGLLFATMVKDFSQQKSTDLSANLSLDNYNKDPKKLEQLVNHLQRDQEFIFYALEHTILPTIKTEQNVLEHNSNQHAYLYRSIQGISGTTDNYRSIAKMKFDEKKYLGTNGVTIDYIVKKDPLITVLSGDKKSLIEELLKTNPSKHAIIDAGGLFTGVTNVDVARKIADFIKSQSQSESSLKYVLFFNDKNQLSAINVNNPDNIIVVGSSDKEVIKKVLGCTENDWFTYYDQLHTEGTDILQQSSATACITFSYDTVLTKFLQAAMRMRNLSKDQKLEIFMEPHIVASCFNKEKPNINQIIEFLNRNETVLLTEEHLRYALQQMTNILYQDFLQILLQEPNQDTKAEIFKMITENSSLFLKQLNNKLFDRYGTAERQDVELTKVLVDKKQSLVKLREILFEKINKQDSRKQQFSAELDQIIEIAQQNCQKTITFKENMDQDTELEAEEEKEVDIQTELQVEAEQELETFKAKQQQNYKSCKYDNWICDCIEQITNNRDYLHTLKEHVISMNDMLTTSNCAVATMKLDDNLYISKNHAQVYETQQDLFNEYRMVMHHVLMVKHSDGTIQAVVITPNEVQDLLENKKSIFDPQEEAAAIWVESPAGVVSCGVRPAEVEKNLQYLTIKEQIKFVNGDLKNLLMQDRYLWLPRSLETKKQALEKLLLSRPEQTGFKCINDLLFRVKTLRKKYEDVAIGLMVVNEVKSQDEQIKLTVMELFNVQYFIDNKNADFARQLQSACKLIVIFNDYKLTQQFFESTYKTLSPEAVHCLLTIYEAKQLLSSSKETANKGLPLLKINALQQLSSANIDVFKTLFIESFIESDFELIDLIFKVCPDILNQISNNDQHPIKHIIGKIKNYNNYYLLERLLKNHFHNRESIEKAQWLQDLFVYACGNKDFKLFKILIENSKQIDVGLDLEKQIIILLAENFETDLLNKFTTIIPEEHKSDIRQLKETSEKLADDLKNILGYFYTSDQQITYVYEQPNFSIALGNQLMVACKKGNYDAYMSLISSGATITSQASEHKQSILYYAIIGGNNNIITDLLTNSLDLIDRVRFSDFDDIISRLSWEKDSRNYSLDNITRLLNFLIKKISTNYQKDTFTAELSKLFKLALHYNLLTDAQELIGFAKANNIDLFRLHPNLLLDCIKETEKDINKIKLIVDNYPEKLIEILTVEVNLGYLGEKTSEKKMPLREIIKLELSNRSNIELINYILDNVLAKLSEEVRAKMTEKFIELGFYSGYMSEFILEKLKYQNSTVNELALKMVDQFKPNDFLEIFIRMLRSGDLTKNLGLMERLSLNKNCYEDGSLPKLLYQFLNKLYGKEDISDEEKLKPEQHEIINRIINNMFNSSNDSFKMWSFVHHLLDSYGTHEDPALRGCFYLLQKHAKQNDQNKKMVMDLLTKKFPGNIGLDNENLLLFAIRTNDWELVELILQQGGTLFDTTITTVSSEGEDNGDKYSAMDVLCKGTITLEDNSFDLLRQTLQKQINKTTPETYLKYWDSAVECLNIKMIQLLFNCESYGQQLRNSEKFKEFLLKVKSYCDNPCLGNAEVLRTLEILKWLLNDSSINKSVNSGDYYSWVSFLLKAPRGEQINSLLLKIFNEHKDKFICGDDNNTRSLFKKFIDRYPGAGNSGTVAEMMPIWNVFIEKVNMNDFIANFKEGLEVLCKLPQELFNEVVNKLSSDSINMLSKQSHALLALLKNSDSIKNAIYLMNRVPGELTVEQKKDSLKDLMADYITSNLTEKEFTDLIDRFKLAELLLDDTYKTNFCLLAIKHNNLKFLKYLLDNDCFNNADDMILISIVEKEREKLIIELLEKDIKKSELIAKIWNKYQLQVSQIALSNATSKGAESYSSWRVDPMPRTDEHTILSKLIYGMLSSTKDVQTNVTTLEAVLNSHSLDNQDDYVVAKSILAMMNSIASKIEDMPRYKSYPKVTKHYHDFLENKKNEYLKMLAYPGWCANVLEYFEVKNFEQVKAVSQHSENKKEKALLFYNNLAAIFKENFSEFKQKFDQAVSGYAQSNRSGSVQNLP